MRLFAIGLCLLLVVGCKKGGDSQAGTATQAGYSEVIGSTNGYIIQNAKIVIKQGEQVAVNLNDALKLGNGTTNVLVIRGTNSDNSASTILALQFPAFAEGTVTEFDGSASEAQFYIFGKLNGAPSVKETGLISGSVRCGKTQPSTVNLGLNRDIQDGVGDMEIMISNIQPGGFKYDAKRKYTAHFTLPMIKLDEMARLNMPS